MSWFDRDPEDLAGQSEPAEALEALRALEGLNVQQMLTMDLYLHQWVMTVLLRDRDREGVLEVQELCELAQDLAPASPEGREFLTRWKAWDDLLEGKRYSLLADVVEVPVKLLQEEPILQRVSAGPCRQSELAAHLKISPGRVSQVLGALEAQGKIVRQRRGKESWVSLPVAANTTPRPRREPVEVSQHAGLIMFRRQA